MAEIIAFPENMIDCSANIKYMANTVNGLAMEICKVETILSISGSAEYGIKKSLGRISSSLKQDCHNICSMANSLGRIAALYKETERNIASEKKKLQEVSVIKPVDAIKNIALINGSIKGQGKIIGFRSSGEVKGDVLGGSWNTKLKTGVKYKDGKLDSVSLFAASVVGEAHLTQGSLKGNIGLLRGQIKGSVGKISGKGEIGATLYKDGKFSPQLGAGAEASIVGAEAEGEVGIGTDNTNVHVGASGKAGIAKVKAEVGIGKVSHEKPNGQKVEGYGIKGEAGAEAYAAEGKVSGGVTILGIKIDAGLTGKAGGAGIKAGGAVTTGGIQGSIGAGFGLGVGLDISIDWSGFKWGW